MNIKNQQKLGNQVRRILMLNTVEHGFNPFSKLKFGFIQAGKYTEQARKIVAEKLGKPLETIRA